MATRQELNQAVSDITLAIQAVLTAVAAAVARLEAKINAGQDFQAEKDLIDAQRVILEALVQSANNTGN